jgi:hypothetical protein
MRVGAKIHSAVMEATVNKKDAAKTERESKRNMIESTIQESVKKTTKWKMKLRATAERSFALSRHINI